LSFEDTKNNKLLAFLRIRITNEWTLPVLKNCAIVRELHTSGHVMTINPKSNLPAGGLNPKHAQHVGFGKQLMIEAEKIVKNEFGIKKIAVIAGVGVREYYKKLGYRLKDEYMIKNL